MVNNITSYLQYVKNESVRENLYKVEILSLEDESPILNITGNVEDSSGSLTISNEEGTRRTCSLTLCNYDKKYSKMFDSFSIGRKFKLYLGNRDGEKEYWFPQGVFVFDDPTLESNMSDKILSISGTDKWSLLDGTNSGILDSTYYVPQGTTIKDFIVRTLALDIVGDFVPPIISPNIADLQTTYEIVHQAGEYVSDILLEVALNLSCYIYYDQNGRLNVVEFEYDAEKSSSYFFDYEDINYIGANKVFNYSEIYNATKVIADNMQNENDPIVAEAINNDGSDPNSVPNLGVKKVKMITEYVAGIDTQQKADERVRYELKIVSSKQSSVSLNSLPLFFLAENTIVSLTDEYLQCNEERFLVTGISFSIGTDSSMSLTLGKAKNYL